MKDLEKIFKAFANKRRLAIIKYLKTQKEASVGQIADEISLSLKATSKHLGILSAVDMVDKEQKSLMMFYRISNNQRPVAKQIIALL